ncbi:hypothetical protein Leryth_008383 [Lithospermum erythrorhizon]|nr:hypothetical protein Leryth_008383 [Lithospermum erythrorhizon]
MFGTCNKFMGIGLIDRAQHIELIYDIWLPTDFYRRMSRFRSISCKLALTNILVEIPSFLCL